MEGELLYLRIFMLQSLQWILFSIIMLLFLLEYIAHTFIYILCNKQLIERYNRAPSTHDDQNGCHAIDLNSHSRQRESWIPLFKFLGMAVTRQCLHSQLHLHNWKKSYSHNCLFMSALYLYYLYSRCMLRYTDNVTHQICQVNKVIFL